MMLDLNELVLKRKNKFDSMQLARILNMLVDLDRITPAVNELMLDHYTRFKPNGAKALVPLL